MKTQNIPVDKALYARVKAEAKRRFAKFPCVPLYSRPITRMGPTTYDKLYPGEEILAYDCDSGNLVWSEVEDVNLYDDAPLMKIGKPAGFSIFCTPNHKWIVKSRFTTTYNPNFLARRMIETQHLNSSSDIVWCGNPLDTSENNFTGLWLNHWSKKDDWIPRVLAMSPLERECFLASAIIYDGCEQSISKVRRNGKTFAFTQKNLNHYWATVLAAFCNGYYVSMYKKTETIRGATIIREKKTHSTQNLVKENAGRGSVWCPTTSHGTWVMIQNGVICVTGNSAYASAWLVREYKKRGGKYRTTAKVK